MSSFQKFLITTSLTFSLNAIASEAAHKSYHNGLQGNTPARAVASSSYEKEVIRVVSKFNKVIGLTNSDDINSQQAGVKVFNNLRAAFKAANHKVDEKQLKPGASWDCVVVSVVMNGEFILDGFQNDMNFSKNESGWLNTRGTLTCDHFSYNSKGELACGDLSVMGMAIRAKDGLIYIEGHDSDPSGELPPKASQKFKALYDDSTFTNGYGVCASISK